VSGGYAPDLRASTIPLYDAALQDVVVKGSRQTAGMPRFTDLTDGDLKALQHYIRREARR
jgi:quinohemoprotein ethanol dehydrogenase